MNLLEEIEDEDERFRGAIKRAAYECEGDLYEVVEYLSAISKQRQREIFARHNQNNHEELRKTGV